MNRQTVRNEFPDERIDAALRMAGGCPVPAGLEVRVQQRVCAAAETKRIDARRWVRVPAAVGVAVAILVAIVLSLHSRTAEHLDLAHSSVSTAMQTAPDRSMALLQPVHLQGQASGQVLSKARHHDGIVVRRHAANLLNYPLTKQERLLVQFARTATPAELQMLNSEHLAKVEAQQEAEFAAYLRSGDETQAQGTQAAGNPQTTQE